MRDFKFTEQERPTMANFNARFDAIATLANGLGNEYVWGKQSINYSYSQLTGHACQIIYSTSTSDVYTWYYADSFTVENGKFILQNPKSVSGSFNTYTNFNALVGKYAISGGSSGTEMWKISETAVVSTSSGTYKIVYIDHPYCTKYTDIVANAFTVGYVNSPDPNSYPPAVSDGYTYTALGQLGAKVQIATGSYTGTGTYGASNPNSLTFEFEPKVVFVYSWGDNARITMLHNQKEAMVTTSSAYQKYCYLTWGVNTVSWYNTESTTMQLNKSPSENANEIYHTYYYIAIG